MENNTKVERTLRIIMLLSGSFGYKIGEISRKFNISERSVYRELEIIRNIGLVLDKNSDGYIKIEKHHKKFKELHNLLQFSEEEFGNAVIC